MTKCPLVRLGLEKKRVKSGCLERGLVFMTDMMTIDPLKSYHGGYLIRA